MSCSEFRSLIDDLIDGELSRRTREEARAHAGACAPCREELARARRLVEAASELPVEIAPRRDLWESVAAGIGSPPAGQGAPSRSRPPRGGWRAWHAGLAAALVVVVAAAGLALTLLRRPEPAAGPGPNALPAEGPVQAAPVAAGPGEALGDAGRAFLEAKQALREAFQRQQDSLSPGTVRKVEENLRIIEDAVAEIQAELGKDPGNPRLERMLVAAQQREVAFLRKVTKTAASRQR